MLTGITMTLFLFPSVLTDMTHTLDSPGRYQASNLFSSLLGLQGAAGERRGRICPWALAPCGRPGAWPCKLSFPCYVSIGAGELP